LAAKYFFKLIEDKDSYDKINVDEEFIENTFNKDFVNVILWENDDEICWLFKLPWLVNFIPKG